MAAKKLFYKIGEACKKVDVQPYVLRYWETEFELLSPDKSKSGQRVYTEQDLAIVRRIKELLYDEGYTTVGAKKKLEAEMADPDSPLGGGEASNAGSGSRKQKRAKAEPPPTEDSDAKGSSGNGAAERDSDDDGAATSTASEGSSGTAPKADERALRQGVEAALEQARDLLKLLRSR